LIAHSKPLREICVGHEWSFGKNRAGNLTLLKQLGAELGFNVIGIPPVMVEGHVVSSTAIRNAIKRGKFDEAETMLGRPYSIVGTVTGGEKLGAQFGFPTANLS